MSALVLSNIGWRANVAVGAHILALSLGFVIPLSNALTTIISSLLVFTCILYMDKATWRKVLNNPTTLVILGMVALTAINCFASIGAHKDMVLAMRKATRLLYFPLLLPLFTQRKWRHFANIAFLVAVLISVVVAMIHTWAFFKDTIFTSLFVSFAIFMLLHYSVDFKRYRFISVPLILFFSFYLFFIGTGRAGQLLCLMLGILFLWQRVRLSQKIVMPTLIVTSIMACGLLTVPSSFVERQAKAINEVRDYFSMVEANISHESSMGIRLILARNSLDLIKMQPLTGFGSGAFKEAYNRYAPEAQYHQVVRANPHNQYLLTWVELGLPGLIALLLLFASLLKQFLPHRNLEAFLGMGLCLAVMVGCTMNSWLLDFTSAFFFIFFAAVYAGMQLSRSTT